MRSLLRRLAVLTTAASTAVGLMAAPAMAETNPYSPEQACHSDWGGTWSRTSDGSRAVTTPSGARWGTVYLMYNASTGYNCVATIKTQYLGTATLTGAFIWVRNHDNQGEGHSSYFKYYESFQTYARGSCVQYWGETYNPSVSIQAIGGRFAFGNCN